MNAPHGCAQDSTDSECLQCLFVLLSSKNPIGARVRRLPSVMRALLCTALALASLLGVPDAMAQIVLCEQTTPGPLNCPPIPAGLTRVVVTVRGGGGGDGAWCSKAGGWGREGASVVAEIDVVGGELVSGLVGDRGASALPVSTSPVMCNAGAGGAAGGSGAAVGGGGGNAGSAPGTQNGAGGGGGGSSLLNIGLASVHAGGGGGGGGAYPASTGGWGVGWGVDKAGLERMNAQCGTLAASGGAGSSAGALDGGGGGGGGGGFQGGAGGQAGNSAANKHAGGGVGGSSCVYGSGSNNIITSFRATSSAWTGLIRIEDPTPPALVTLNKALGTGGRAHASDQFTVEIRSAEGMVFNSAIRSTTMGTNASVAFGTGTTGVTAVPSGRPHTLFERMAAGSASTLDWYNATLTCTGVDHQGTALVGLPNGVVYNKASGYVLPPLPISANVTCTLTNEPIEARVSGTVFRDDGDLGGAAVPNNGVQDGAEGVMSGVTVRLTDCAATPTVLHTTTTDSNGHYSSAAYWPPNTPLCVEAGPPGWVSTGASVGAGGALPAGYAYSRSPFTTHGAPGRVQLQLHTVSVAGLKLGFVPQNSFFADDSRTAGANETVFYAHRFRASTDGIIRHAVTGAASSGAAAWAHTTKIYDDVNCDGILDAGEVQLYPALVPGAGKAVTYGDTCIVVSQLVPANVTQGDVYTATVDATFDYAHASPALSTTHTVHETTTAALATLNKAFSSTSIHPGQTSDLSFTITNTSPVAYAHSGIGFTDNLPGGLALAAGNPLVSNTCGGTVTAAAGGNVVTLAGGAMTATTASCVVTVRVTTPTVPTVGECSPIMSPALTNRTADVTTTGLHNGVHDTCLAVRENPPTTLSGRVFVDNGAGGGTANNGIRDGGEAPIVGTPIHLTNCAAPPATVVYASGVSDGTGHYLLNAATVPATAVVCVEQTNLASYISTGASLAGAVLPAGYTYVRPATHSGSPDHVSFQWLGSTVAGLDFGDVMDNTFTANGQQEGLPGGTVNYAHTFTAATAGKVTFSVTNSRPDWAATVFADALCTGSLQAGATQLFPPLGVGDSVVASGKVCIVVRQFIPATATLGEIHAFSIGASFDYANNPALPAAGYTLTDQITVGAVALSLKKEVRNVTVSGPFGVSNQAKPGDELEYRIVYTNNAPSAITDLAINDITPAYTTFISSSAGLTPAALGACSKNTPANPRPASAVDCTAGPAQPAGGTGALHWVFGGGLEAGASGEVLFRVKVD
ncbi:MAG: hypothetical protein QM639_00275 [Rhodocyclaceae bacterium]